MGPKKTAAEKEAERLAAEEQARKDNEAAEKKAAIEAEKKRQEELRIAAERKTSRIAEVNSLTAQYNEYLEDRKWRDEQRAKEEKLENDERIWTAFCDPSDEPSANSEVETNSFLTTMDEQPTIEMSQLMGDLRKIQRLASELERAWSELSDDTGADEKYRLSNNFKNCLALIKKKIDFSTAHTLKFADMFLSTDGKYEITAEETCDNSVLAWWASFSEMRPNRKKIDNFDKLGVQMDLPKQFLQAGMLLLRLYRTPYEPFNLLPPTASSSSSNVFVVGDCLIVDLCVPPPQSTTIRAKRWVIRDSSATSNDLKKIAYPVSVKSTFVVKIAPTVVMTDDIRMQVFNEATNTWSEDGITEFQYSESTRQCQFYLTTIGTLALTKSRIADFPYKKWSLHPICDRTTIKGGSQGPSFEKQARFTVNTFRHEIVIDIVGSRCKLVKPVVDPLSDLIGVLMAPSTLIHKLQRRGINISPNYCDAEKIEGNVAKEEEFETDILFAISRCASTYEFKSSQWNKDLPPSKAGILMRESTVYVGLSDTYDYECILAEMDNASESHLFSPDVPLIPGRSGVKYMLVLGDEYGTKKGKFSHSPRPKEVHQILLHNCMNNRNTQEAKDRLSKTNERFANAIYTLLKIVKPYSF